MANCRNCPDTYTVATARYSPAAPALPAPTAVCPTCGGLECLCRPRFFDGQLLSADDLTRLERYIIGKNRLHNRYLHGWGVVCGLEVVCDPCKDQVIVRQGYALSPCGDDIVVCADVTVPICDLITQCGRTTNENDCYSSQLSDAEQGCKDSDEPWVLSICYDEKPSRGITPLRASGGSACCSKCAGGGSSACGCSCHEKTAAAASTQTASRYTPAQCEPSVQCEGYRFTVSRATNSAASDYRKRPQGEMAERFNACLTELFATFPDPPQDENNLEQDRQYLCAMLEATRDFLSTHGTTFCQLDEKLAAIAVPHQGTLSDADYQSALGRVMWRILEIQVDYIQSCACSALLPPCPDSADENCVPLATVTIQRSGCRILGVCNFNARRFALTVPAFSYWLSALPIGDVLRNALAKFCCTPIKLPNLEQEAGADQPVGTVGYVKFNSTVYPEMYSATPKEKTLKKENGVAQKAKEFSQVFAQAWASRSVGFEPQNMILDAMGATDAKGLPFLSIEERRNPLAMLLANQFAVPLVETFAPRNAGDISNLARSAKVAAAGAEMKQAAPAAPAGAEMKQTAPVAPAGAEMKQTAPAAAGAPASDFEQLKAQVDALKRTVDEQQRTIDSLSKGPAKKA